MTSLPVPSARTAPPPVAVLQPIVPDYRLPLFGTLAQKHADRIAFFAGAANEDHTLVTIPDVETQVPGFHLLDNRYLLGGRLLWQRGYERELAGAGLLVANGSLRIASTLLLLARRARARRPTVLWGHIRGRHTSLNAPRDAMIRAADGFIAYTDSQAEIARQVRGDDRVWSLRNSCVWARDCVPAIESGVDPTDIVCVGRLIAAKKPDRLLRAFHRAVADRLVPAAASLVFVGDGPMLELLKGEAVDFGIADRVHFLGHVTDTGALRRIYARALCAASPGYVGLSAIQAFAFGTPMLIARDEPHSPEIEACREDFNAVFVSGGEEQWSAAIGAIYAVRDEWLTRRSRISAEISGRYTFDAMIATFEDVVNAFAA